MINSDSFKSLLLSLNFTQNDSHYSKKFGNSELSADFDKQELIYPEAQGLTVNERQTCNFKQAENFVVFECVHRLLEKGYAPESIELEPKWKVGHGASGGRADILIRDKENHSLLIIECKTAGKEFTKAWQNTLEDGGQLFGYAANEAPDFLCLYASNFITDKNGNNGEVKTHYFLISLKDNADFLAQNAHKELATFSKAKTREQLFNVWKNTYQQEPITKGIFEHSVQAYLIGKQKIYLEDLQSLSGEDIQPKYHEFATILRQHNVSGRENAFDKLVNLFLCKILDETTNSKKATEQQELKFYWKGFEHDTYFDLIDRLQQLYQEGMGQFLNEPVTYVDNKDIETAFRYYDNKSDATRDTVKDLFKQLKYFTNSDFAFIDVHNESLFYQNSAVLLKIVTMLQDIRLFQKGQHNQFLGDLFEGFLDSGIKQSEGQFFTPMPICRFIMQSLPLKTIFTDSAQPPKAIDYACGAGHFLNELAMQITPFIEHDQHNEAQHYHQQFYGIEKEYRLSKVAKVSAFMYGQDKINIIYGDALATHKNVEDDSFSLLVANPPYSVKGFLATLAKEERAKYELIKTVNDKNFEVNNSIETFFIERAKQLLKSGGVAAIIVPSSILSNSDSTYTTTRALLLAYFDIIAIVEFGSGTFGKTNTNTLTLFLRRKDKNPETAHHYDCRVKCWFEHGDFENKHYEDAHFIQRYCAHIHIPFEQYQTLLHGKPSEDLLAHEMFVDYQKDFDNSTDIKKLATQKFFKDFTSEQKQTELEKRFLTYLRTSEKDKLFYFVLAFTNPQKVLVIKSPSDNKEQKAFLGYEWSAAKGNEGIKLTTDSNGNHLTPLYDETNRDNPEKINTLITQNFLGELSAIPDVLQPFASLVNLVDMLDFSRKDFDKTISLTVKKSVEIQSKWDLIRLGDVCHVLIGGTPSRKIQSYFSGNNLWVSISEMSGQVINDTKEKITDEGVQKSNVKLIPAGATLLSFKLSIGKTAIAGKDLYTNEAIAGLIPKNKENLLDSYLYQLFNAKQIDLENTGFKAFGKSLNSQFLKEDVKIPLPPLDIQQQIVSECEAIDGEVEKYQAEIESTRLQADDLISMIFVNCPTRKISQISDVKGGKRIPKGLGYSQEKTDYPYIRVSDFSNQSISTEKMLYISAETFAEIQRYTISKNDVYISIAGTIGLCGTVPNELDGKSLTENAAKIIIKNLQEIDFKFLSIVLNHQSVQQQISEKTKGIGVPKLSLYEIDELKIPVPDLETQQTLVSEIETFEKQIDDAQKVIDGASSRKAAVLRNYL